MIVICLDNGDKILVSKETKQELRNVLSAWKGDVNFFSNDEVSVRISEIVYVK